MGKIVETKRERATFCTYRDLIKKFRLQSIKMNESMSRRIENFIISELAKQENEKSEVK